MDVFWALVQILIVRCVVMFRLLFVMSQLPFFMSERSGPYCGCGLGLDCGFLDSNRFLRMRWRSSMVTLGRWNRFKPSTGPVLAFCRVLSEDVV